MPKAGFDGANQSYCAKSYRLDMYLATALVMPGGESSPKGPAVFDGMQIAPRHQLLKRTVLPMEPGGLVFPSRKERR